MEDSGDGKNPKVYLFAVTFLTIRKNFHKNFVNSHKVYARMHLWSNLLPAKGSTTCFRKRLMMTVFTCGDKRKALPHI